MNRTIMQTAGLFVLFLLVSCGSGQQTPGQDENAKSNIPQSGRANISNDQNALITNGTGSMRDLMTNITCSTTNPVCSGITGTAGSGVPGRPGSGMGARGTMGQMGVAGQGGRPGSNGMMGRGCSTTTQGGTGNGDTVPVEPSATTVAIDIQPGGEPNSIDPESEGVTPVAILSSSVFEAPGLVDRSSLTFGVTGYEESLSSCKGEGEDVNNDGLVDLVCHFTTELTGFRAGDTEGVLKGSIAGDILFEGRDSVRIVPIP